LQIKRVTIENFRSIRHAEIELGSTTVLIGPNNAGKTAILEAIRIALTRRWGQRGTGFTEYDVHLCAMRTDPKVGDPVVIEIEIQESVANEWPEELHETLADIIQLNPISGQASIILRVSCAWDDGEESYVPKWEFLNVDRNPLAGKGARATNFQEFFSFLPVFYLDALRDAADEFAARSQFWGRLLRTVQIPEPLEQKSVRIFNLLNAKLLAADPLLGNLATSLSDIGRVATTGTPGQANLRVLPLNTWDLLSKAEVIYQTDGAKPWLPLMRHGQGVQSLSVMFLFRSFVELLLAELYRAESTPVLALEEPETHLHPQASRSLFGHIATLQGQKIVSTHSPYFLQHVPFRDLRVVRAGLDGTEIKSLPREFRCRVPSLPALNPIIANSGGLLIYDGGLSELVINGTLPTPIYNNLLSIYHGHAEMAALHAKLRAARDASLQFIPDDELTKLETFARRIRGEIFFANKWLLVEGQSEYHLVHGMAKAMGYDFDEHGVAVIDFQNNGNPECFAALARSLGYPWVMVVDGDIAGNQFLSAVGNRNFTPAQMAQLSWQLPAGTLEQQLVADGIQPELKTILAGQGVAAAAALNDAALVVAMKSDKCGYAAELAAQCAASLPLTQRMPLALREAITTLRALP
jgi:putative ATP-dependent endonuclease of OLD family